MGFILGAREGGAWAFVQVSLPPGRAWEGPSQPHRGSGMRGRKQSERLTPQPHPPTPRPRLQKGRKLHSPRPPPRAGPLQPLTEQADAQPGQALPEPLAQALGQPPPPLLLPLVVLLVQRQAVHVPRQACGQVGDGGEGA